jgi:hypothetical protein
MRWQERRSSPRVDVVATAVLWLPDVGLLRCKVEDLSIGGALLRCAPEVALGLRTRLSLLFDGADPLLIEAELVRWNRDEESSGTLAVVFHNLSARQEDAIQDALLKALETLNGPASGVRKKGATDQVDHLPSRTKRAR